MTIPGDDETIRAAKRELRRTIRARLRACSPEDRRADSVKVCERIRDSQPWRTASAVLLFAPMAEEVDIWPLLEETIATGRALALPRFDPTTDNYQPVAVRDLARDVRLGAFGIREPTPACSLFPLNQLDFTLLSGLAFDHLGRRLGRGKGYYDRLLPRVPGAHCGVAMDWQVVPAVPAAAHDWKVNYVVTPSRWLAAAAALES